MPKFEVTLWEKVLYTIVVEAKNEDAADEKARDIWCDASADLTGDLPGLSETGQGIYASTVYLADGAPRDKYVEEPV